MAVITGVGYVSEYGYGLVKNNIIRTCTMFKDIQDFFISEKVIKEPFKNSGRFTEETKSVVIAAGCAIIDSGADVSAGSTGIFSCNINSRIDDNLRYYEDYVKGGKILARANLFVYTLSTSALAEAAIAFGLRGPLFTVTGEGCGTAAGLITADDIVENDEADAVILIAGTGDMVCAFCVESGEGVSVDKLTDIKSNDSCTVLEKLKKYFMEDR